MYRAKFFAALPFLHYLDDSNLEEAFPTISDSPDGKYFKGSTVKQVRDGEGGGGGGGIEGREDGEERL